MDYCSSCRRHLNGALVCPGCGAYAPDIAPPVRVGTTTGPAEAAWDMADVADAPVVAEGRAARRRQRARWKKNQRKAVVATAVALVGGGLTVSAMNQGSNARTQAATSPDDRSMGLTELPTSDDSVLESDAGSVSGSGSGSDEAHRVSPTVPSTSTGSHRRTTDSVSTTTRSSVRTDSVTAPTPTATTASGTQSQGSASTSTTSGTSGTSTSQTSTSTATDNTGSDSTSSGSSDTSQTTTPSSSATDPAGLCVLNLLCIS